MRLKNKEKIPTIPLQIIASRTNPNGKQSTQNTITANSNLGEVHGKSNIDQSSFFDDSLGLLFDDDDDDDESRTVTSSETKDICQTIDECDFQREYRRSWTCRQWQNKFRF